MDDEVKQLLRELLLVQKEQAAIIKRYLPPLWTRIRFSMLTLLLLMTITAIGMGVIAYKTTGITAATPAAPAPTRLLVPPMQGAPYRAAPPKLISPPSVPSSPVASAEN
jgi:hypothetical protein